MLRQVLSIGITLLLVTGAGVEARKHHRQKRAPIRSQPHSHRPVHRPPVHHPPAQHPPAQPPPAQHPPVKHPSGLDIHRTPFSTPVDYISWVEYVCEKLYQAGDWPRLKNLINLLSHLSQQVTGDIRQNVAQTLTRQRQRLSQWLSASASHRKYRHPVDREADRLFDLIQRGYYLQAKGDIRKRLEHQDYIRQSESMKYVIILTGLVQYDGMNPKAVLPIWFEDWNLRLDEKISALIRAKQLCQRTRQEHGDPRQPGPFRPFGRINQVDALVLTNLGRDVTNQFHEQYLRGNSVEQDILRAGMALKRADYCHARDIINKVRPRLRGGSLRRRDTDELAARADEMCRRRELDNTFRAFCQVGHEAALPIGEALAQTCHKPHLAGALERMFWLRITAGDCGGAQDELNKVQNAIPWQVEARHDYLKARLRYMKDQVQRCRPRPQVLMLNNRIGERLMALLWQNNLSGAETSWQTQFSQRPLDQSAMLWRKVLLAARYPKVMYAPCTGNSLLTGDEHVDRDLFVKLETIKANHRRAPCNQPNNVLRDRCNLQWAKAAYVAEKSDLVREYGRLIKTDSNACNEVHQLVACITLCSSGQGSDEACWARNAYGQLGARFSRLPQTLIGIDLARRLCATRKQLVLDSSYLRHGPTPRPISYLLRQYESFLRESRSIFPHHEANPPIKPQVPHPPPVPQNKSHKPPVAAANKAVPNPQRAGPILQPFGQTKAPPKIAKEAKKEAKKIKKEAKKAKKEAKKAKKEAKKAKKEAKKATKEAKKATKEAKKVTKEAKKVTKEAKKATKVAKEASKQAPRKALHKPSFIVHPEEHRIKLPKPQKHVALLQAQATLCPCMKIHYKVPVPKCNPEANRLKLVQAFARFLRIQHIGGCCQRPAAPIIKHYNEKELAQSGAMQVAADLFAKGKLKCPCFKVRVVQQHKIHFNPPLACNCPCLQAPPKPIVKTIIKTVHVHDTVASVVPKPIILPPPPPPPPVIPRVQKHVPSPCASVLMTKFPFLKDLMGGGKSKPCKRMSKKVRRLFEEMIQEVEADCQSGMAQAMMKCHQHHLMPKKH